MLGLLAAFGALLSWGFGDFSIQRSTRVFGDLRTLVYIGLAGIVVLSPFIVDELPALFFDNQRLLLLSVTGLVIFVAALLDFEALKQGKIAVIEPVLAFELPVAVALSSLFLGERLTPTQFGLTALTFAGIVLAVTEHHTHLRYHRRLLEPGVLLAITGAIIMGGVNFLVGVSSQQTSPLMAIWFTNLVFTLLSLLYMFADGSITGLFHGLRKHPGTAVAVAVFDNAAWICYAVAASLIPIAIATTISESYIALAVLLGLLVSHERLQRHQMAGIVIAVVAVIILSLTVW